MTHMTPIKTKAEFKKRVKEDPSKVYLNDPSCFQPRSGSVEELTKDGYPVFVTNDKRTWFAQCKRVFSQKLGKKVLIVQ